MRSRLSCSTTALHRWLFPWWQWGGSEIFSNFSLLRTTPRRDLARAYRPGRMEEIRQREWHSWWICSARRGGCRRPSGSAFSAPNCWARRRRIGKISSWAYIPMGFYTGAAGLPGRFREGFCLRRVQTCSQYPQSGSPTSHRRPGVAREAIHPPCPKREDIPGNQAQEASPFDTK